MYGGDNKGLEINRKILGLIFSCIRIGSRHYRQHTSELVPDIVDRRHTSKFVPDKDLRKSKIRIERTTNCCESFHSKFNSCFYSAHPNIFQFMDVLKEVQIELRNFHYNTINAVCAIKQ
jgi:hypothetical protein